MEMILVIRTGISRPWTAFRRNFASRSDLQSSRHGQSFSEASHSKNFDDEVQRRKKQRRRLDDDFQIDRFESTRGRYEGNSSTGRHQADTFDNFVAQHQDAARRSILVRFSSRSPHVYDEAYFEIRRQLKNADVSLVPQSSAFKAPSVHSPDGLKTFFLLETTSRDALEEFIERRTRSAGVDNRLQPCRTRVLHYTADFNSELLKDAAVSSGDRKKTKVIPGTDTFSLNKALGECRWIDEQMRVLVDETMLTEDGTRLRFFVASLIEDAFRGVFPYAVCLPFGSTVNGFGNSNSDLDMDFAPEDAIAADDNRSNWLCAFRVKDNDRKHIQYMVDLLGRMIRCCMPYCTDLARILNARVPIVKFVHEAGGFGCDITVDNLTGAAFSKILWMYSRYDTRFRPLFFTVRRWASAACVTRETPGEWFTNFQLLCLMIYFFQSRYALPSIKTLRRLATSNEAHGIIGDPEQLAAALRSESSKSRGGGSSNGDNGRETLRDSLLEFFKFYGHDFAFHRSAINLEMGLAPEKVDFPENPVVIYNPTEANHNITRNVTQKELEHFRSCARTAVDLLENEQLVRRNSTNAASWGLLALFDSTLYKGGHFLKARDTTTTNGTESGILLLDEHMAIEIDGETSRKSVR